MMLFSYKKTTFLILSIIALLLIASCGPVGDDDGTDGSDFSNSDSSSATGSYFTVGGGVSSIFEHKADIVIGQKTFTTSYIGSSPENVYDPYGNPTVVDDMLYLPDFTNDRVLGYNTVPTTNGEAADFSIAPETFGPQTVTVVNGKFFITDWGNSRILIYNKRPLSSSVKPDIVVGQVDMTGSDENQGNTTPLANTLNYPESLFVIDDKLIVADSGNNRVLIWNSIPTVHNTPADIVLGQADFDKNATTPVTELSLNNPTAVWSDGTYLVVLDTGNNRVLIWNTFPTTDQDPKNAKVVLGQLDFNSNNANQSIVPGASPSASTLNVGTDGGGLYSNGADGSQLFVADGGNNRILVWDNLYSLIDSTSNNEPADGLMGQKSFTDSNADTTEFTLSGPTGVYQFYNKLIVTDTGNNRYLIFNSAP